MNERQGHERTGRRPPAPPQHCHRSPASSLTGFKETASNFLLGNLPSILTGLGLGLGGHRVPGSEALASCLPSSGPVLPCGPWRCSPPPTSPAAPPAWAAGCREMLASACVPVYDYVRLCALGAPGRGLKLQAAFLLTWCLRRWVWGGTALA